MELLREEFTLLQRECLACGRAGAAYLLLQPADEHDLSGIEEEAKLLAAFEDKGQLPGHGLLVAVRVNDWSSELSPWEAPQPSGSALFGDGAPALLEKLLALIRNCNAASVWRRIARCYSAATRSRAFSRSGRRTGRMRFRRLRRHRPPYGSKVL